MRGATNVTLQTHHILRLPRKMTIQHLTEICGKQLKRHFQCAADPRTFREWSEHDPRPFPSVRNPPRNRGYFSRSGRAFCIEKYNISRSGYLSKFHQVLRLPRKVTLELHQVLRLPRKVTLELHQVLRLPRKVTLELHQVLRLPRKVTLDLHQLLRLPRKVTLDLHQLLRLPHRMTRRLDPRARSNKCHPPNSPHTAPATQNDHPTSGRNLRKTAETSFPMRGRSDQDPITFRDRSQTVSVSPQPATQQRLLFALRTSVLYWKIQHFALRLSFQISPSTAPTTKSDTWTSPSTAPTTPSDTWTSPSTAPATKSDTWTSPSTAPTTQSDTWPSPSTAPTTKSDTWPSPTTAPATQNDSQAWSSSHMKRPFQCEEQQMSPAKLTTYCACHAKWPSNIWQKFAENSWNVISNARPIRSGSDHVPRPFRDRFRQSATRHATEVTFRAPDERFVLKNTTFRAPAIFPNFTKYCAYHEKWHLNFTKYCAYHAKWHFNFTKYCACHEKWHLNFTKYCAYHEKWHLNFTRTSVLYWKIQHFALRLSFQISPSTAPTTKSDTSTSPSTAPTTQSDTSTSPSTAPATKSDTGTSPSTAPAPTTKSDTWTSPSTAYHAKWHLNFTKYCACHEKWHLNFTKYCAYHAKWHLTFTNYCAYHAKWHLNLTKYYAYHEKWHLISAIYYAAILLSDSINWLYYYSEILLIDSTSTQRSITQRFY